MFGPHTDMSGLWLNKAVHTDTLPRKLLQKLHFFVTSTLYQLGVLNTSMMRFSCILFTIYLCRCKSYRSRSKALHKGLLRAIPNCPPLRQAEMPQIRAVHLRRVSLCLDRDSRAGIGARAGNYAAESKRLLESDCSTLSLNRALCETHC